MRVSVFFLCRIKTQTPAMKIALLCGLTLMSVVLVACGNIYYPQPMMMKGMTYGYGNYMGGGGGSGFGSGFGGLFQIIIFLFVFILIIQVLFGGLYGGGGYGRGGGGGGKKVSYNDY